MRNVLTVYGGAFVTGAIAWLGLHAMPTGLAWTDWRPFLGALVLAGIQAAWSRYHLGQPVPQ